MIDQRYLVSWNNKQATGFRGADSDTFSSAYRSLLLEDRLKPLIKGARKTTLPQMIDAMELAGTTDLRAHVDLPLALEVIGRPKDSSLRRAVDQLRAWQRAGGRRNDGNQDKVHEHAAAIRLLDAWWPLWVRAQFRPALGGKAFKAIEAAVPLDNAPNNHGDHLGSAYQTGWYGYVRKDLRTVLGRKVRGRYARKYCGGGPLRRCRQVLRRSLRDAIRARRHLRRRQGLRRRQAPRRSVVLRRRPPAPRRRRHAAAHPLDQPPDLPASGRGPGTRAALTADRATHVVRRHVGVKACARGAEDPV